MKGRIGRMALILKRGSWECWLAGSNRVDLSPPASLRIRNPCSVRKQFLNSGRSCRHLRIDISSRRYSQLPDSLPDALSDFRRSLSFHQFPDQISLFQRPSEVSPYGFTSPPSFPWPYGFVSPGEGVGSNWLVDSNRVDLSPPTSLRIRILHSIFRFCSKSRSGRQSRRRD